MRRLLLPMLAILMAAVPLEVAALALSITSPGPLGLDQGRGCEIASPDNCIDLDAPAPATGTLTITGPLVSNGFVSADVSILVPSSSFGGGTVTFAPQTYTATGVSVLVLDDGVGGFLLVGMGFAPGAVSPADPGVQLSAFNCGVNASLVGQCGFTWGGANDFTADGYRWTHTFNVVVPEPTTLATLFLGVTGLAVSRRRSA